MKRKQLRAGGKIASPPKDSVASLYDAGLRHFRSGLLAVAEERIQRALASDPQHAGSLHLAGQLHAQANRVDLAIDFIMRAIRIDQGNPEYFSSLGTLLARQGQFAEALKSYNIALSLNPRHLDAADKSGSLLIDLRRYGEALARFEQSDTVRPGQSETLFKKAVCLQLLARLEEAAASYTMALAADAKNHVARNNLGAVLLDMGRFEEAVGHFRKVIEARPDLVNAFNNLGFALTRLKRFDEALTVLDRAVTLDSSLVEAVNNRGNVLRSLDRQEEAMADFDRAIALKPDYANAHANRGACLDDMFRFEEALASYRTALALKPDHGDAHWNLAINRLRVGDYKTGWAEAEWRWKAPLVDIQRRRWDRPLWLGSEPIAGKTLLLFNDQGLGDAIQFCRYIPRLAERGAKVILEIDRPLRELLSGIAGIAQVVVKGEALPEHDFHCPLMSLPLAFGTMIDTIPPNVPYVSAGRHTKNWGTFLGATRRPRIGVVWSGNPLHANDRKRSLPLAALKPLFDTGAQFVSLQKNARDSDLAVLREHGDILDAAPELESFADTATLIQQLDLVISVDTSVAHLAGALGKPVWILLPYVPDYRWLLDRDESPWYPTARLYRQTAARDYAEVIDRVRADLSRDAAILAAATTA
jgi:tetratricopeptide (TPR) repeat protein